MFNICLLLIQKRSSNLMDVIEQGLSLDGAIELRMIILEWSPILLSDHVASTCSKGLVNKKTPFIKTSFKTTNHCLSRISHFKMNLLIDFISNIVEPVLYENNLVNVIQFRKEKRCLVIVHWLQILQNFDHELLVLEISPSVITVSIWTLVIWNAEVPPEVLKESFEQEVCINSSLDFDGKLFDNFSVCISWDWLVFVVTPSVIEEFFHVVFHFELNTLALVKLLKKAKEFWEVVSIIKFLVHWQERIRNLNEIAHYDRENRNSKQKHKSRQYPLIAIEWM